MNTPIIKLKKYRVVYTPRDNKENCNEPILKFTEYCKSDKSRVTILYLIYIQQDGCYSIYVEYDFPKNLKSFRKDLENCGLLKLGIQIGKLKIQKKKLLNDFIEMGLLQKEYPYIYYNDIKVSKLTTRLLKL